MVKKELDKRDKEKKIIINNLGLVPEDYRESFDNLSRQVENIVKLDVIKHLSGGISDSAPVFAYAIYENTASYQVFKVGNTNIIKSEAENWDKFVKDGHFNYWNVVHLKNNKTCKGVNHSLIIYDFAGMSTNEPVTFEEFYNNVKNPHEAVTCLFEDLLKPHLDAVGRKKEHKQITDIIELNPKTIEKVKNKIVNLSKDSSGGACQKISLSDNSILLNTYYFYPIGDNKPDNHTIPLPWGIIHGDMNEKNLLFYDASLLYLEDNTKEISRVKSQIPCIIDYAYTGRRCLYEDIAKLESVLKFRLLNIEDIDENELLLLENTITSSIEVTDQLNFSDQELNKLFLSIKALRIFAWKLIETDENYNSIGYWLVLYKHTIRHIDHAKSKAAHEQYAFISASIILTKHLANQKSKNYVFTMPKEYKDTISPINFSIKSCKEEVKAEDISPNILDGYKNLVYERWGKDKVNIFPEDVDFIEPLIRLIPQPTNQSTSKTPTEKKEHHRDNLDIKKTQETKTIKMKELASEKKSLFLVADSGYGKTTLLRKLQYDIFRNYKNINCIPVYFHLRDLTGVFSENAFIERLIDVFPEDISINNVQITVRSLFSKKCFFFLLDGLDQVENKSNLPNLIGRWGILSGNRIILAGRPYAFSGLHNEIKDFDRLELDIFSLSMARSYLGKKDFSRLKDLLKTSSLRSPMVLAILKDLDTEVVEKANRTEIYESMIESLLTREVSIKAIFRDSVFNSEILKTVFSKLSHLLLDKGYTGSFPWSIVESSFVEKLGITFGDFARITHLGIISEVIEGSPIPGNDIVFRHQSFQEFFACLELSKRIFKDNGELNKEEVLKHLEYFKWDEVFLFLAGSSETNRVSVLIKEISRFDLNLAGKCTAQYRGDRDKELSSLIDRLFKEKFFSVLSEIGTHGILTKLIKMLNSDDNDTYWDAKEALGKIGSDQAVTALIKLLNNDDIYVRSGAVEALGEIGSDIAIPALVKSLNDDDKYVRGDAAKALGKIGSDQAVPALVKSLHDDDVEVRKEAAKVLGEIGSDQAISALVKSLHDDDVEVRDFAVEALGKIGSYKVVTPLIKLLHDDEWVRWNAVEVLRKIGSSDKAVKSLVKLLHDNDKYIRWNAVAALGKIGSDQAVPALIKLFKDDKYVRGDAAAALGKIGSDQAVPALIKLLKDDKYVRGDAAETLGKIGSDQAVPALVKSLHDDCKDVRRDATEALGRIGSDQAVPALVKSLHDDDVEVRKEAAKVLGKIGSDQAIPSLVKSLHDDDKFVRWNAAEALKEIGSDQSVPALIKLLNDDKNIRVRAAEALGEIGSDQSVPALIKLLNDDDEFVRWNAVKALRKIGSDQSVLALIKLLNKDKNIRERAAEALGEIGSDQSVPALIKSLNDDDELVRWNAAEALGKIGSKKAVLTLIKLLNGDKNIRKWATEALGEIGSDIAIPALVKSLNDDDRFVRWDAAKALGKIGSDQAAPALIKLLKHDKYARGDATKALGEIGSDQAVPALIKLLNHNDKKVGRYYEEGARKDTAKALGLISKKMLASAINDLVIRLRDKGHYEVLEEIKRVHKKRFLHLLAKTD